MKKNEKKRIAVFLPSLSMDGISILFKNLSYLWDHSRFEIVYFLTDGQNEGYWENDVIKNNIRVVHIKEITKRNYFLYGFIILRALTSHGKFDVVHVNLDFINGLVLFVAKLLRIPLRISHIHSSYDMGKTWLIHDIHAFIMRKLTKFSANIFLAPSDLSGKYFYKKLNFRVINNGIFIDQFLSVKNQRNLKEWKFISVGSFIPLKNPLFLLDVFCEILKIRSDSTMTWIGSGKLKNKVVDISKERKVFNNIRFLDQENHVNEVLKRHDYFLFPSVSEGLGIALIEAQAAGLDCFISDGIPKSADCGKCLQIELIRSPAEWAKTICDFISSGRRLSIDMDKLSQFDIHKTADELMNIYESI